MRSADHDAPPEAHGTGLSRRHLGAGLLATLAVGLLHKTAEALPEGSAGHFTAATEILQRYGLSVTGAVAATPARDVLTISTLPQPDTQYDGVLYERTAAGTIIPCVKTSSFQGTTRFEALHESGIDPCFKTTVDGALITSEVFHEGDINPCYRTELVRATHGIASEVFHEGATGEITPCYKTTVDPVLVDGAVVSHAVAVDVIDTTIAFSLTVGPHTWDLKDGGLELRGVSCCRVPERAWARPTRRSDAGRAARRALPIPPALSLEGKGEMIHEGRGPGVRST